MNPFAAPFDPYADTRPADPSMSIPDQLERIARILRQPGLLPVTNNTSVGELLQRLPLEYRDPLLAVLRFRDSNPVGHDLETIPIKDMASYCAGVHHTLVARKLGAIP